MQLFFYIKYFINLIFFNIFKLNNTKNQIQRDIPLVLSLYSDLKNLNQLELCLYSIFEQNLFPNKIILYIDKNKFSYLDLPYRITRFVKYGLIIKLKSGIGEYSAFYYSLLNYPSCVNVVVNENCIYSNDWLKTLYLNSIVYNDNILIMKAKKISLSENNDLLSYEKWKNICSNCYPNYNFPIIQYGILFPPKCFKNEFFRKDIFLKVVPTFPAVWIWVMAILSDKNFYIVEQKNIFFNEFFYKIIKKIFRKKCIRKINLLDKELCQVWDIYGNIILYKLLK